MKKGTTGTIIVLVLAILVSGCATIIPGGTPPPPTTTGWPTIIPAPGEGIHKIRHVIIIMQENRAFDEYFGTYPGADGIPMMNSVPTVCIPTRIRTSNASAPTTTRGISILADPTASTNLKRI